MCGPGGGSGRAALSCRTATGPSARCSTAAGPWAGSVCSRAGRAPTPAPCPPSASTGVPRNLPMGAMGPRRAGGSCCSGRCQNPDLGHSVVPGRRALIDDDSPHLHAGDRNALGHHGRHRHIVPGRAASSRPLLRSERVGPLSGDLSFLLG